MTGQRTTDGACVSRRGGGCVWVVLTLALTSSPPQTARIPTESDVGPISSVGSSHNRPAAAEDNEEALLLALPGHRSCGREEF
jgi:hypothetical protein